jgi:hypothetical protein
MKSAKILISLLFILFIISCGGGGGGSSSGGGGSLSCESNGVPKFSISSDSTAMVGQPFTETYSWCDSDGDITEVWAKVTYKGATTQGKFNASDMRIIGASGTQQNRYTWTLNATGDYYMEWWAKDAKGNTSNIVPLQVTVSAKNFGQYKTIPAIGGGFIEKILR